METQQTVQAVVSARQQARPGWQVVVVHVRCTSLLSALPSHTTYSLTSLKKEPFPSSLCEDSCNLHTAGYYTVTGHSLT